MRAVILERNKIVGRRIARLWTAAGFDVAVVEDPAALTGSLGDAHLLGADAFDGDLVLSALAALPSLHAVLWTAEPLERVLRFAVGEPRLSSVLGRPGFESTPRDLELTMVARRRLRPAEPGAPFAAYLAWGAGGLEFSVRGSADRERVVAHAQAFTAGIGAPKRVAEMMGELAHELLMNALYDAPVDAAGRPRFAHDRRADVALAPGEEAIFRLASDGARLVLQVVDPFGRLQRQHVFAGLARGLKGGQVDSSHGGAGLGMLVVHNATVITVYDVGVFDLDLNLREFRTAAKSLHFFSVGQ